MNHQPAHVYVGLNSLRDLAIQHFFSKKNLLVFALSLYSISASGQDLLHAPLLRLLIPNPEKSWPLHRTSPRELIGQAPT